MNWIQTKGQNMNRPLILMLLSRLLLYLCIRAMCAWLPANQSVTMCLHPANQSVKLCMNVTSRQPISEAVQARDFPPHQSVKLCMHVTSRKPIRESVHVRDFPPTNRWCCAHTWLSATPISEAVHARDFPPHQSVRMCMHVTLPCALRAPSAAAVQWPLVVRWRTQPAVVAYRVATTPPQPPPPLVSKSIK